MHSDCVAIHLGGLVIRGLFGTLPFRSGRRSFLDVSGHTHIHTIYTAQYIPQFTCCLVLASLNSPFTIVREIEDE